MKRNSAKWDVRQAVQNYEKVIAKRAKTNPKAFCRHLKNKLKIRVLGSTLNSIDRAHVDDNQQKAELFNEFFSCATVYTTV